MPQCNLSFFTYYKHETILQPTKLQRRLIIKSILVRRHFQQIIIITTTTQINYTLIKQAENKNKKVISHAWNTNLDLKKKKKTQHTFAFKQNTNQKHKEG